MTTALRRVVLILIGNDCPLRETELKTQRNIVMATPRAEEHKARGNKKEQKRKKRCR